MASQIPPQDPAAPADATQNPQATAAAEEEPGYLAPLVDPRLPTRKDSSLRDFISKIDDYAPIVSPPHPICLCSKLSFPKPQS